MFTVASFYLADGLYLLPLSLFCAKQNTGEFGRMRRFSIAFQYSVFVACAYAYVTSEKTSTTNKQFITKFAAYALSDNYNCSLNHLSWHDICIECDISSF